MIQCSVSLNCDKWGTWPDECPHTHTAHPHTWTHPLHSPPTCSHRAQLLSGISHYNFPGSTHWFCHFVSDPSTPLSVSLFFLSVISRPLDRSEDRHLLVVSRNWSEPEQHMNTSAGLHSSSGWFGSVLGLESFKPAIEFACGGELRSTSAWIELFPLCSFICLSFFLLADAPSCRESVFFSFISKCAGSYLPEEETSFISGILI